MPQSCTRAALPLTRLGRLLYSTCSPKHQSWRLACRPSCRFRYRACPSCKRKGKVIGYQNWPNVSNVLLDAQDITLTFFVSPCSCLQCGCRHLREHHEVRERHGLFAQTRQR